MRAFKTKPTGRPKGAGVVPDAVRFERHYVPEPNSGCWLWTGPLMNSGYGNFYRYHQPFTGAHRFSYEQFVGPIPGDLTIDHICCNKLCVNPEHLRLMTRGQNTGRYYDEMTHCRAGHEYTEENTRIINTKYKGGILKTRQCRECARMRDAVRREQHNAYSREYQRKRRAKLKQPEDVL